MTSTRDLRRGSRLARPRTPALTTRMPIGLAILLALSLAGLGIAPTYAANDFPAPAPGSSWFGADLDWDDDDADLYTQRLGSNVSLLARSVDYPLTATSTSALSDLAAQARTQGAVAVLSLEPSVGLDQLTPDDARDVVEALNDLTRDLGTAFLIRFAPEMNASWTSYGQQPTAYVDAFVVFADVVHTLALSAATAWVPAYGGGYPFGGSITDPVRGTVLDGALSATDRALLDTNGNGRLDVRDDPYGPYFPGVEAVDWVGLTMLRYGAEDSPDIGTDTSTTTNTIANATELQERLEDEFEYPAMSRPGFYERYAVDREKPMLLLTGAAYSAQAAEAGGPTERAVKGSWLRRVLSAARARPQIKAVVWFEPTREEPEVGSVVRWGLTTSPALGRALGRILQAGELDLAPLTGQTTDAEPGATDDPEADDSSSTDSLIDRATDAVGLSMVQVSLLLLLTLISITLWLTWQVRRQRMRPPWE
ncbi:glycoside hydrolase family 26 protein [Nocardioides salsibiostraticola]